MVSLTAIVRELLAVGRLAGSVGAVAGITALYALLLHVNPTTVALSYLVAILLLATGWGIAEATTASVVAMLCFNFFFLPPVGTFTIADPQNWVALVAFLVTAIVASQLSGRARQREIEALARQRDLERLYALSRALLLSERGLDAGRDRASCRRRVRAAEPSASTISAPTSSAWAGRDELAGCRRAAARRRAARRVRRRPSGLVVIAIQLGGAPIGSLAVADAALERHRPAVDREPRGHRPRTRARRTRPRRAPKRRARAASCARRCSTRWRTSSRRR